MAQIITDGDSLTGATTRGGYSIQTYDDGFGQLWISRNSIGINGIVRAQSFEGAYGICEDEFFQEADETVEQLRAEYGFKREPFMVVKDPSVLVPGEHTSAGERFARYPEDYPNGKLAPEFIKWVTVETPDPDAWTENELFCEAYGFRNNGPNDRDKHNHGIYQKDLNGDSLDLLTPELLDDLGITLQIEREQAVEVK